MTHVTFMLGKTVSAKLDTYQTLKMTARGKSLTQQHYYTALVKQLTTTMAQESVLGWSRVTLDMSSQPLR